MSDYGTRQRPATARFSQFRTLPTIEARPKRNAGPAILIVMLMLAGIAIMATLGHFDRSAKAAGAVTEVAAPGA